jgi:TonB family protein
MFTNLSPDSSVKQPVTFLASLCLQFAVLAVVCCLPPPPGTGAYLRSSAVRASSVTPIYFQKDASPAPLAATASKPAPEIALAKPETKPVVTAPAPVVQDTTAQDTTAQAGATDDGSADGDGQAVAAFPAWRMNAMSGFAGMHHTMKAALPVFTPDPEILHGKVPEQARGKDVVMEVMIDDQGSIVFAKVVQGVGYGVEQSIVETLRRWIFVPAKINGVGIASKRQLTFHLPS